jgi:Tol biopolymer transport system component
MLGWGLAAVLVVVASAVLVVDRLVLDHGAPESSQTQRPDLSGLIAVSRGLSPDASSDIGGGDVYVVSLQSRRARRVTSAPGDQYDPSWSPDGTRIVFRSFDDEIHAIDSDGTRSRNLSRNAARDISPDWSPVGNRIAFASTRDGMEAIWTMDGDGRHVRSLGMTGEYPSWSPDGRRLTISRYRGPLDWGIWMVEADGSGAHPVVDTYAREYLSAWSPTGTWIAFTRGFDGKREIWLVSPDGRTKRRLTRGHDDFAPTWSPDGRCIIFTRDGGHLWAAVVRTAEAWSLGISGNLPDWR